MTTKGKITYRVEVDELRDLCAEGKRRRLSTAAVARDWMRSWMRIREKHEALENQVMELMRDNRRLLIALAKVCTAVLCRGGKESPEKAEKWVRENILARN
jgi:hypothetical protein